MTGNISPASIFTGFRGGDGLVTLAELRWRCFPYTRGYYEGAIGVLVAIGVALCGQKLYPTRNCSA